MKPIDLNERKPPPAVWDRLTDKTKQNITLTYYKSFCDKLARVAEELEYIERARGNKNGF